MSVQMPVKEYLYLTDQFHILDGYVINVSYVRDDVILDFLDQKKENFKTDYKALIMRVGLHGKESFNETGVHLNNIYDKYINPQIDE